MDGWTCPECGRRFGRRSQGHECSPAMALDDYFAASHERERPIYEVVAAHLDEIGDHHVEAVSVGIFFKNGPRFAELRSRKKWVALCFMLPVKLESGRLSRKVISTGTGNRWYHVVNIGESTDVDDQILDWLTEAYLATEE